MSDYSELFLLRHGQTKWNLENRIQGQANSDLTPLGIRQAKAQAEILAGLVLPEDPGFFCSPLGRARQTAQHAFQGISKAIVFDDRLKEIAVGAWEGRLRSEVMVDGLHQSGLSEFEKYTQAPGGEGFASLERRVLSFLTSLTGPAVVLAHGISLTILRGLVLGLDFQEITSLDRPQGRVIRIADGEESIH